MLRRRPVLPGCHTLRSLALLLAILVASSAANAQAAEPELPRLMLTPQASFSLNHVAMLATEVGGTLAYRFPDVLDVGIHAAMMADYSNKGSSASFGFYPRNWWRAGGTVERHFGSRGDRDPWIGAELEAIRVTGYLAGSSVASESRVGLHIAPKAGIDWLYHGRYGLMGFGLFAAVPVNVGLGLYDVGVILGVRASIGVF
jgi:hypothetical protein